jgi:hypothetical protein
MTASATRDLVREKSLLADFESMAKSCRKFPPQVNAGCGVNWRLTAVRICHLMIA